MKARSASNQVMGRYVYGIMNFTKQNHFEIDRDEPIYSSGSAYAQLPLTFLGSIGIGRSRIFVVGYHDIAAVVSDIPLNEARQLRILINSPSKETHNIEYVLSHQKVIEGIHKAGYVIVPIRFGSILTR